MAHLQLAHHHYHLCTTDVCCSSQNVCLVPAIAEEAGTSLCNGRDCHVQRLRGSHWKHFVSPFRLSQLENELFVEGGRDVVYTSGRRNRGNNWTWRSLGDSDFGVLAILISFEPLGVSWGLVCVCRLEFGEVYVQTLVNVGGNWRLDSISPVRQFSEYTREPNVFLLPFLPFALDAGSQYGVRPSQPSRSVASPTSSPFVLPPSIHKPQ
jgi:hypothetical protein